MDVSDIDSDIELDDLLPTYLKVKGKLYEIDPCLVEATTRKQPKGAKGKKGRPTQVVQTPGVRKLLSQLQQIASDALFDEREAEALWPAKRNQIAQDRAARRLEQGSEQVDQNLSKKSGALTEQLQPKQKSPTTPSDHDATDDEVDFLGEMFTAVPNEPNDRQPEADSTASENVTLRDFGKSSGLTPRRLLEEAVRSRLVDVAIPLTYVLTSSGTQMPV